MIKLAAEIKLKSDTPRLSRQKLYFVMMQKILAYLLVILILVPSLVCAMPLCGDKEEAAIVDAMEAPCPDHPTMIKSEKADITAPMVIADCLDIELLDTNKYSELNSSISKDSHSSANDLPYGEFQQFHYLSDGAARAPPGDKQLSPPTLSVILSTQRFRI